MGSWSTERGEVTRKAKIGTGDPERSFRGGGKYRRGVKGSARRVRSEGYKKIRVPRIGRTEKNVSNKQRFVWRSTHLV